MRPRPFLLLSLFLAGCADLVGVGGDCASEMRELRQERGQPTSTQGPSGVGGDFTEVWLYGTSAPFERYTFRWGASHSFCEVTGPQIVSSRSPVPPPLSPARADGGR